MNWKHSATASQKAAPGIAARTFTGCLALVCLFGATGLLAQDAAPDKTPPAGQVDESVSAPERANYLERHHAIRRVNQIKGRTLTDIKRLKILVANFGPDVEGAQAEFEKIRELYHSAEKERYRRRFVASARLHEGTRKLILDLYKKFTTKFQDQTAELLAECAENMVDAEFAVSGEPGQSTGSTARIFNSSQKLYIAYQQTAMAENMIRTDRFDVAITHYRLAKSFAINVLRNLEDSSQKQNEIEKKYKVDLLDARGLTSVTGTESKP